jgi:hypothetical protein
MRLAFCLLLMAISFPCFAGEEETLAALRTAGIRCTKSKKSDGYFVVFGKPGIALEKVKLLAGISVVSIQVDVDGKDDKLPFIKTLPGIKRIAVGGSGLRDADLKHVAEMPSLESVHIYSDNITDKGLLELASLKGLKHVMASSLKITQDGKEKLNELIPGCTVE